MRRVAASGSTQAGLFRKYAAVKAEQAKMSMAKETHKSCRAGRSVVIATGLWLMAGAGFAATASTSTEALPAGHAQQAQSSKKATQKPAPLIDINSASKAQLKTLYGVGDAEADRIIAARPFKTKTDLVTTAGLPTGIYVANKHKIIAIQKTKSSPKG